MEGRSRREVMKYPRPFFACVQELVPSPCSQPLVRVLTTFGSREPETRVALGIPPIRAYAQGLGKRCFEQRAGHNAGLAKESNQRPLGSPGPGSTSCRLPIAPQAMGATQLDEGHLHRAF
jgi:hypothetical protein